MPSVVLNPDANDSIPNQTSVTNDKPPAPGVVPPSQSLDPQALVQSLKDILARDASGAAHTRELREVAYRLSIALERPGDTVQRVAYYPLYTSAIRIAMNLDLFAILVNDAGSKSSEELAKITGADRLLLTRILRFLAAIYVIQEDGEDKFSANNVSKSLSIPNIAAGVKHTFDTPGPAYMALPEFLERTKYQNPTDSGYCAFNIGHNTKEPPFRWLETRPDHRDNFNVWMSGHREGRANWLDFFPFEERLCKGSDMTDDQVLLVDVGGGYGHEIQAIKTKYPAIRGRMILQDLPQTIAQAVNVEGMEATSHDFFKPQPIKGARAYYMRNIFHDWPDAQCKEILSHIAKAMDKENSKLIINELVVPNKGATVLHGQMDLTMMATFCAMERTESHWFELVESAGLVISKIWTDTSEAESVIEAILK